MAESNLGRRIAGVVLALGFFIALAVATQREALVECEVCMVYAGQEACRKGSASDRDGALRGAINNACAVLSSGVTRGMECDRTPPRSVECSD